MTVNLKTTEQVRDEIKEYDRCPKEVTSALLMYLDNVENMLETDDFLPGMDVQWNATIELFVDVIRAAHFELV